jgi:predicted nucleic-acid-binding Zn-ribbon protein
MSRCPKCGRTVSFLSRDLVTGECKDCREIRKQDEEKQRQEDEQQRMEAMESKIVNGKKVHCPICENDRFRKQNTLMNTRGATMMDLDWMNASAQTCICKSCGYVLWFRENL